MIIIQKVETYYEKIISLVVCVMTIVSSCTAYIYAVPIKPVQVTESNEYDIYLQYMSMSDDELKKSGRTEEEIELIRNFSYEDEIKKRAKLSDEVLETYGYSEEDIEALREVATCENITEESIRSISNATLKSYIRVVKYSTYIHPSNGLTRYALFAYKFKWYRVPLFGYIDGVAISFSSNQDETMIFKDIVKDGDIEVNDVNDYRLTANLTNLTTGEETELIYDWGLSEDSVETICAEFPVALINISGVITHMCWSGSGRFRVEYYNEDTQIYVDAVYGHAVLNLTTPDFSVGSDGIGVGISFGIGIDEQHRRGRFNKDFTIDKGRIYHEGKDGIFGYGDTSFKTYL